MIELVELQRRAKELDGRRRMLDDQRQALSEERDALAKDNRLRQRIGGFAERVSAAMDSLDFPQRQKLLRLVIEEVRVSGWDVEIRLRIPLDEGPPTPPPVGPSDKGGPGPVVSSEDRLRSLGGQDDGVVQQSIEEADCGGVFCQESAPVLERPVRADAQRPSFVGPGHHAEEELRPGGIHGCEADLIDQDQIGTQDGLDDPAHGVVGHASVKRLDQLCGGEVPDPHS